MVTKHPSLILITTCISYIAVQTACVPKHTRAPKPPLPTIVTHWEGSTTTHRLRDEHLELRPLFYTFDESFFKNHLLPIGKLSYRDTPHHTVETQVLSKKIEQLLKEIHHKKKVFNDFIVLKKRDFNVKQQSGTLVLKFKQYPFVLKLFMETPESFVHPYNKGIEPHIFFTVGGGITRHLTGFTRIKNMKTIEKKIANSPWAERIQFPRKWFWLPNRPRFLYVHGHHFDAHNHVATIRLPSVYGIIADEIDTKNRYRPLTYTHAHEYLAFCEFLNYRLDPHITNCLIENGTNRFMIIDTENFRTLYGIKEPMHASNYISWYWQLGLKFVQKKFFSTRRKEIYTHHKATRHHA